MKKQNSLLALISLLILLISQKSFAQSILIEPGKQGFNTTAIQNNTLEIQGNGLLIQAPYRVSTVNPNSTVLILPNASTVTSTEEAGILKDPNGDSPYLAGTAFNATAYLNLPNALGVKFTFELLDTEVNGDSVIISDHNNTQIARYSGNTIPVEILIFAESISTNKYYVRFKTDNDANVGQGFVLRWQTLFENGTAEQLANVAGGSTMFYDRRLQVFRAGLFTKHNVKEPGRYSAAFGNKTEANGTFSFAAGNLSKANGSASFAFGTNAEAGDFAYSMGYGTKARGLDAFAIGFYNDISSPENTGLSTDRLFEIGNGLGESGRQNALTVLRNGQMGISTVNPRAKLHVYEGNSGVTFTSNSSLILEKNNSHFLTLATPEASESGVLFSKPTTGHASGGIIYGTNNSLSFRTNGNVTRMTIGNTGRVGIGVAAPLKTLDISSTTAEGTELQLTGSGTRYATLRIKGESNRSELIMEKGTDAWSFYNVGNRLILDYDGNIAHSSVPALSIGVSSEPGVGFKYYTITPGYLNNSQLGSSASRFREIWSTNALNTSSDRRLKKDIKTLGYGLEEILKLQAVSYKWKNSTDSKLHLGFIAQDVENLIPEIVTKSNLSDAEFETVQKNGGEIQDTYGMEYTGLIPVLVKAIQEQQNLIRNLENEIALLKKGKNKLTALENRLASIESSLSQQKQAGTKQLSEK